MKYFKKKYSIGELYITLCKGFRTMKYMSESKKSMELSAEFIERIMLAVTEVNGCEVCSYAHTKMALEHGMSSDEIQLLLSGSSQRIPGDELTAILFAQHYADSRGNPSCDSWQRVLKVYGEPKAMGILGATRMIMIGNVSGLALSAFQRRLKGKPVEKSSIFHELGMILCSVIFLPTAFIHGMISDMLKKPVISCE